MTGQEKPVYHNWVKMGKTNCHVRSDPQRTVVENPLPFFSQVGCDELRQPWSVR